jgi:thiamine-monophosphate kinase
MGMGEFELIERYFKRPARQAAVGIGDDCAVWTPRPGHQLAFSADMLVEGRHFLSTVSPRSLGHKALAVNLSDLAACGATPRAFLLSLSLPNADDIWLSEFSQGLLSLADAHACELIGGDTTRGPLNIAITVMGETPHGQSVLRSTARTGDDIYVSGHLGDARLALEVFRGRLSVPQAVFDLARARLETPTPRIALGTALRGLATAMADVSDGLLGDLGHILKASGVGAQLNVSTLSQLMLTRQAWDCPRECWLRCVLSGGDDYELVFTAPPASQHAVEAAALSSGTPITRIGRVTPDSGLVLMDDNGEVLHPEFSSFDHFA